PDGSAQPRAPSLRCRRRDANLLRDALGTAGSGAVFHLGRHRRDAAQPVPFPACGLNASSGRFMGLIALAVALLIEQLRPLHPGNRLHRLAREGIDLARQHSRTDRRFDAVIAWFAVVAGSIVLVLVLQWIAAAIGWLASFMLPVGILYMTVGFRQFGHNLRSILAALERGEPARAGRLLEDWIEAGEGRVAAPAAGDDEVGDPPGRIRLCRATIVHALVCAHRELFAPILAYLLLPGAIGPAADRLVAPPARPSSDHDAPTAV